MADRAGVAAARVLIERAVTSRVFPAAAAEVGDSHTPLWRDAFGHLTFDDDAVAAVDDTVFDLASLTKPLATATVIARLAADKALALDDRVAAFFEDWRGADREAVTVRDLLEHTAGLAARLVDPPPVTRREFEHEIGTLKLEYPPRAKSVYSDLGFILLGFLAEDRGSASLDCLWDRIWPKTTHEWLGFGVRDTELSRVAPTMPEPNDARRGRRLIGEVHDDYAAALSGVAGHAGMFGNTAGLGAFARAVLRAARGNQTATDPISSTLIEQMTRKSSVPGSSRALGWDTMLPTSSCGTELSPAAFGHVGFTGTSLWIDPILDRYFILLTNRACGGGSLENMREVRRAFHNALATI